MYHPLNGKITDDRQTRARIKPGRRQQAFADGHAQFIYIVGQFHVHAVKDDFTD
ncbi:hypothetical protein HMPREF0080_00480 [Anaeroglobus geminatus F0357]|uniref:Uncharacterized protein n=1 Tax=Anaeroglobus geminatus F0357 TaxID=861450 RepID=G9YFR7_9FIRM|nr:hypothetical protein HMPREF0080_00480 [Anaeroglobus geminatus F0357]